MKKVVLIFVFALCSISAISQKVSADPWFGPDKTKHFIFSTWGTYALSVGYQELNAKHPFLYAAGTMLAVGAGKELVYDKLMKKGNPSMKDFTWDVAGCAFGYVTITIPFEVVKRKYYKRHEK